MNDEQPDNAKPAAYDAEGRPLFYQPPAISEDQGQPTSLVSGKPESHEGHNFNPQLRTQYANEPKLVHATRTAEPRVAEMSEEIKRKHQESVKQYPALNLSDGEFVVLQIRRHPIGLLIPVITTALVMIILMTFAFLIPDIYDNAQPTSATVSLPLPSEALSISILMLLGVLVALIGTAAVWVYQRNQFFMTNESVIQEIQHSLFSHHEQVVSLGSIEDASFTRKGMLQHLFNYGTMRLSTEGEETTYRFAFVENPKDQISIVSNAVEAFKNGRPVLDD